MERRSAGRRVLVFRAERQVPLAKNCVKDVSRLQENQSDQCMKRTIPAYGQEVDNNHRLCGVRYSHRDQDMRPVATNLFEPMHILERLGYPSPSCEYELLQQSSTIADLIIDVELWRLEFPEC